MRYADAEIGIDLELKNDCPSFMIIENPKTKRAIVEDFWKQTQGYEGNAILSHNGKELSFSKQIEVILNPFNIDFNSRKIKAKLLEEATEVLLEYEYHFYLQIKSETMDLFERIIERMPYPLNYKMQTDPCSFLKTGDICIETDEMNIPERLVFYMQIMRQVCNVKVFILIDICDYFDCEELSELVKSSVYSDIVLLFIESKECYNIKEKRTVIIDKDDCIIHY